MDSTENDDTHGVHGKVEGESSSKVEPSTAAELSALVRQAQNGVAAALPRIRQILDEDSRIWKNLGDIGGVAEKAWIGLLAEKNPAVIESLGRTLGEMRSELSGESPTLIEKMLVNQVVICWLQLKTLEVSAANLEKNGGGKMNRAHVRLDLANKRYLTALRALADLRRFAPGAMAPPGRPKIFGEKEMRA